MSYATASDVASLNKARILGQGNNPTASDVGGYCLMIAGEIDAILVQKGYDVPVNVASYPEAGAYLLNVNALGAHWKTEEASPNSPNVDRAEKAYECAIQMLSDAKTVMNLPLDVERSEPRGPWVTYQPTGRTYDPLFATRDGSIDPCNNPADPYFSRQQRYKWEPGDWASAKTHSHR